MRKHLTVTEPFGDYARGDRIEGDDVAKILKSHPSHVVAGYQDDSPLPEPDPAPEADPKPAAKAK